VRLPGGPAYSPVRPLALSPAVLLLVRDGLFLVIGVWGMYVWSSFPIGGRGRGLGLLVLVWRVVHGTFAGP
jgi:hypothetical protein